MNRRPVRDRRFLRGNRYAKPVLPRPLSLPLTCLIAGFTFGVIAGLVLSVAVRRVF